MSQASDIVDILIEDGEGADLGIDMATFLRDSGVTLTRDDFVATGSPDKFGRWSTGNYNWSIYYKHILYRGKPVYLGSVFGAHDYNRTQRTDIVNYWATPPSKKWDYNPLNRITGKPTLKNSKQRVRYGYGNVHMNAPESDKAYFDNLFGACKYLLSLLRVQSPLRPV